MIVASAVFTTLPIIKNFVKSFDTGFGLQPGLITSSYGGRSGHGRNIEMSPVAGGTHRSAGRTDSKLRLDPRPDQYTIDIRNNSGPMARAGSIHSGHSRQIMIRKDIYLEED